MILQCFSGPVTSLRLFPGLIPMAGHALPAIDNLILSLVFTLNSIGCKVIFFMIGLKGSVPKILLKPVDIWVVRL